MWKVMCGSTDSGTLDACGRLGPWEAASEIEVCRQDIYGELSACGIHTCGREGRRCLCHGNKDLRLSHRESQSWDGSSELRPIGPMGSGLIPTSFSHWIKKGVWPWSAEVKPQEGDSVVNTVSCWGSEGLSSTTIPSLSNLWKTVPPITMLITLKPWDLLGSSPPSILLPLPPSVNPASPSFTVFISLQLKCICLGPCSLTHHWD